MPGGQPLIPRDDPLMAPAMLSGRADRAVHALFLSAALEQTEEDAAATYDGLVAEGLAKKSSRGYKLTDAGRQRTHEEYERRISGIDREWDRRGRD
jgi:hypothetical protein